MYKKIANNLQLTIKDQIEYLKKDILYHRKSIESHNRQMELLLLSATNKKFIDDEN